MLLKLTYNVNFIGDTIQPSAWKAAFIRQHRIETNWRTGNHKTPKVSLCLDHLQMGLGGIDSWLSPPLEKYHVPKQDHRGS